MKKLLSFATVAVLVSLVAACAPKKEKERIGRGSRSGLQTNNLGQPNGVGPGMNGWNVLESGSVAIRGLSYASGSQDQAWAIDGLVSSFINIDDPNQYGGVASSGAISMGAHLRFTGNCQIDKANSFMGIVVFDEIALRYTDSVIRIYMGPERADVQSGMVNNRCVVRFTDDYGYISLNLNLSGGNVTGDVMYYNKSSTVNHPSTGRETYLGSFSIPQNGILFN